MMVFNTKISPIDSFLSEAMRFLAFGVLFIVFIICVIVVMRLCAELAEIILEHLNFYGNTTRTERKIVRIERGFEEGMKEIEIYGEELKGMFEEISVELREQLEQLKDSCPEDSHQKLEKVMDFHEKVQNISLKELIMQERLLYQAENKLKRVKCSYKEDQKIWEQNQKKLNEEHRSLVEELMKVKDLHAKDQMMWEKERCRLDAEVRESLKFKDLQKQDKKKWKRERKALVAELGEEMKRMTDMLNEYKNKWEEEKNGLVTGLEELKKASYLYEEELKKVKYLYEEDQEKWETIYMVDEIICEEEVKTMKALDETYAKLT